MGGTSNRKPAMRRIGIALLAFLVLAGAAWFGLQWLATPPKATAAAPPPADAPYAERELAVDSPLGPLPGTLTLPSGDGPFPAVVLVHGSGPHDRDETIGPNRPFLELARGLAGHGIASLRYVKRTSAHRDAFLGTDFTVDDETVDDAVAAVAQDIPQPLLVLQGGRDYQVVEADFARWREAFGGEPRARLVNYPELNHLFIAGTGPSRPEEYFQAGTVDARVIADIAAWISAAPAPSRS